MSILKRLEDRDDEYGRIVSFTLTDSKSGIELREECDGYFCTTLNKAEFGQMIAELQALHAQMVE